MDQIALIRLIQSIQSPLLDFFWGMITQTGSEEFLMIVLPLLYWFCDTSLSFRFIVLLFLSEYCNDALKQFFAMPRPSPSDVRVIMAETGGGYGFPSGHSQRAVVFWGYLPRLLRHRFWVYFGVLMMILVGLSRLYLGVHFPMDVVGGWLIGAIIFVGGTMLMDHPKLTATLRRLHLSGRGAVGETATAILIPLALALLNPSEFSVKVMAVLAGFGVGYVVIRHRLGGFPAQAPLWVQVVKLIVGIAGIFALRLILKPLLPATLAADFLRYLLMGLWGSLVIPWLACRLAPAWPREMS